MILNKHAELAVSRWKSLNSPVRMLADSIKTLFYQNTQKGYQTSQMYNPVILAGYVDAPLERWFFETRAGDHAHMGGRMLVNWRIWRLFVGRS